MFEPALKQALQATPIAGVRPSSVSVSKFELMAVPVQTVQADHPAPGITVADWIWNGPPAAEVEATFAQDQRTALNEEAKEVTREIRQISQYPVPSGPRRNGWCLNGQ